MSAGFLDAVARPYVLHVQGPGQRPIEARLFLPHETFAHRVSSSGSLAPWLLTTEALNADIGLGRLLRDWAVHPNVDLGVFPDNVAAFGLHADGVQYASTMRAGGAKSVLVCSFNVISAKSPADRAERKLFFVLAKNKLCDCGCSGFHTMNDIWDVLAWSLDCLRAGVSPSRRHDDSDWTAHDRANRMTAGSSLPKAALLQIRGDWEQMVQWFRFRSYNAHHFCWMCDATLDGEPKLY